MTKNKFVIAIVGALIGWGNLVVGSPAHAITAQEWMIGATYLAIAAGVYQVANSPIDPTAP